MKNATFGPELSYVEREKLLRKLCVTEREDNFFRSLTDSDVDKEKHLYAERGGELKDKKAEAAASAQAFKAVVQALEKDMDERLERIQTRKRKVYDKLYGLPNYDKGTMQYFDRFGELIDTRILTPDEMTGQMFDNAGEPKDAEFKELPGVDVVPADSDVEEAEIVTDGDDTAEQSSTEEKPKRGRKKRGDNQTEQ